jgi:signal transduction histidine kinase
LNTKEKIVSPLTRYPVIWILGTGFALVIFTVGAMAWLGLRQAESIRVKAARLVREHLLTARLIDELEREQQRAGAVLLKAVRLGNDSQRRADALADLAILEKSLPALISEGEAALPGAAWAGLRKAWQAYFRELRNVINNPPASDAAVLRLEAHYDEVNHLAGQIIKEDSVRSAAVESRIESDSGELAAETSYLLGGCLLLALICAALTIRQAVVSLRRIEWQAQEINRVSWHLIQGQEAAARRFSHEMHDELGQSLTALKATLVAVTPAELEARRPDCVHLLEEAIGNVRELSQLLRPVILDDFGLDAALRWLADRFQERTRIAVEYSSSFPGRVSDTVETHLFRITQEALTNVARHSGATEVHISLAAVDDSVKLTVADNGVGLPPHARQTPSLGLVGIRARAQQMGGTVRLESKAAGGVFLEVAVPASQPGNELEEDSNLVS